MTARHATLILLTALATTGCSALDRVNDALYSTGAFDLAPSAVHARAKECGVTILASDRHGRGVITGAHTVLTVAHVVGNDGEVEVGVGAFWTKARVVRRVSASPEDLVEIEVAAEKPGLFAFAGFEPERQAELATGEPAFVLAASGIHVWADGLRAGDSGSPVIDRDGKVVGLLVGRTPAGRGVFTPVAPAPRPEGTLLAALR
jgi:S1-C subfamily serine protease